MNFDDMDARRRASAKAEVDIEAAETACRVAIEEEARAKEAVRVARNVLDEALVTAGRDLLAANADLNLTLARRLYVDRLASAAAIGEYLGGVAKNFVFKVLDARVPETCDECGATVQVQHVRWAGAYRNYRCPECHGSVNGRPLL